MSPRPRLPRRRRGPGVMPGIIRASELTGISVKDLLAAREQEAFDRLATAAEQNLAGIRQSLDDIKGDNR